jgi:poly(rC)-binding protein 2/3/4
LKVRCPALPNVSSAHRVFTHAVIGKGGVKINEIRTQSQCQIRVTDPGTPAQPGGPVNPNERLVIIQGQPMQINVAVSMLHQRLEVEKMKKSGAGAPGAVGMMPPGTY